MDSHNIDYNERFEFSSKAKTWSLISIAIGVIAVVIGFATGHAERTFSNLLLMGYYFTCICMAGAFFLAIQYVAQAGWSASIIRVPQAFVKVLPVASIILIAVVVGGLFTHGKVMHEGKEIVAPYLYKIWALHGVTNPTSEHYDPIIAGKASYLNIPFFLTRLVVFLSLYTSFGAMLVKYSRNEDEIGGTVNYNKSFKVSAIFLVIFGFTTPLFAFDTIMSLEAHWFSTMFGWYNFAAMWVSGLAVITLTIILLKQKGYMQWVNDSHLHDLGKFMFAFSIFWAYVWFSQFLLIYYANIPEETVYFFKRWEPEFLPIFWANIILNFLAPVLILMSRDWKRRTDVLKVVCIVILIGHWVDFYMMIMPGTVGGEGRGFGVEEFGIAAGFVGLFAFFMQTALAKVPLAPKNHPFLQESIHHHI